MENETGTNFESALAALKAGKAVTREGWNGKGLFVTMQVPDENSKMRRPYLFMTPTDGNLVPWIPSQTDIFGDDWSVVEPVASTEETQ